MEDLYSKRASGRVHLSIVIPAYNESAVLPETLICLQRYLAAESFAAEVIVVDDGSTDDTPPVLQYFSKQFESLRVLRNAANQGKGSSVRRGFLASRGEYVLFIDADLPVLPEDIPSILAPLYRGKAASIASRPLANGCGGASPLRRVASILYRRSVRWTLGLPLHDTQFGFKAFVRESFVLIFERMRQCGYSFDVEVLFTAWQQGLPVQEVEIQVVERRTTPRHLILLRAPQMLLDLFRIRFQTENDCRVVVSQIAKCLLGFSADLCPHDAEFKSRM